MSDGRVVMISGAGRGIGAAIASALAQRGWRLSLGVRTPEQVAGRAEALVHRYDAREPGSERVWVAATAARFGQIDAVVNNAGIMIPKSVVEADDAELDAVLDVNVKAPLRLVRAAWPHLAAHRPGAGGHRRLALGQAGEVGGLGALCDEQVRGPGPGARDPPRGLGEGRALDRHLPGLCRHRHGAQRHRSCRPRR